MSPIAELITTPELLRSLAERLSQESIFACDLEADSMHHYQEKVCLLQFSWSSGTAIVDPLAVDDLSPLAPLLANPAIRKVLHGSDYDIRSLHRDFGIEVNNLFDTMIACQFLGEKEFGLAAMLKKRFGVELDKKYQRADWSVRPLSSEMVMYAALDTYHLIAFYLQLEAELRAKGRLAWVEEECRLLTGVRMSSRGDEPLFVRFKGASRIAPRSLAVLEELLRFRDEKARLRDVPPFKIFDTEAVRLIAERRPRSMVELTGISGLSPKVLERYGKGILESVARGMALTDDSLPFFPTQSRSKKSRRQEELLKALKLWREKKAHELGIDAGILANNALLEALSLNASRGEFSLDAVPAMREWQKTEFGEDFLQILAPS